MKQITLFNENVKEYEEWYKKYHEVFLSEVSAIKEQLNKLPENIKGVEIGVGTGKFAEQLGIKEGVEPSAKMAALATKRGVEIINGTAENIPFKALNFDFVLFVTICHLDNIKAALKEAHRVLKQNGSVIIGFIDANQQIAKDYEANRKKSTFFKHATFYSVDRIQLLLKESGFKNLEFNQTLFGEIDEIKEIQTPKEGFGEGSFLVVKATKK